MRRFQGLLIQKLSCVSKDLNASYVSSLAGTVSLIPLSPKMTTLQSECAFLLHPWTKGILSCIFGVEVLPLHLVGPRWVKCLPPDELCGQGNTTHCLA